MFVEGKIACSDFNRKEGIPPAAFEVRIYTVYDEYRRNDTRSEG